MKRLGREVEAVVRNVPGTASVYADRVMGGNYLDFAIDRDAIARHGLTVRDVQEVIRTAIGGMNVTTTIEGLERYPVNLRYSRELRDDLPALRSVLVATAEGHQVPLGALAGMEYVVGPPSIKSEGAKPNAWVYIDVRDIDVGSYVEGAREAVAEGVALPPGYTLSWSGQYEYLERAQQRLLYVIPLTLLLIFVLIYLTTRSVTETFLVLLGVPFAVAGSFWFLHIMGYDLSIACVVGIIALAGLYAETAIVFLLYLNGSVNDYRERGLLTDRAALMQAIRRGSVQRVRPIMMTIATDVVGLLPIMWSAGAGADVMKRIAAPLMGGVVTSGWSWLVLFPVAVYLWKGRGLGDPAEATPAVTAEMSPPGLEPGAYSLGGSRSIHLSYGDCLNLHESAARCCSGCTAPQWLRILPTNAWHRRVRGLSKIRSAVPSSITRPRSIMTTLVEISRTSAIS